MDVDDEDTQLVDDACKQILKCISRRTFTLPYMHREALAHTCVYPSIHMYMYPPTRRRQQQSVWKSRRLTVKRRREEEKESVGRWGAARKRRRNLHPLLESRDGEPTVFFPHRGKNRAARRQQQSQRNRPGRGLEILANICDAKHAVGLYNH